jgi:Fe-S cluster assembly iron-binding protein IscA
MSRLLPVITYRAWNKINDILRYSLNDSMLYSATSGGCNGFSFSLNVLDNKQKVDLDTKTIQPTVIYSPIGDYQKIYIEPTSEMFLYNTEIDYIHEDYHKQIFESKFVFHADTSIMSRCGCGTSFNMKL